MHCFTRYYAVEGKNVCQGTNETASSNIHSFADWRLRWLYDPPIERNSWMGAVGRQMIGYGCLHGSTKDRFF